MKIFVWIVIVFCCFRAGWLIPQTKGDALGPRAPYRAISGLLHLAAGVALYFGALS